MQRPTWGDTIRIKGDAPTGMQPGCFAAVCGMRQIESNDQAKLFSRPLGAIILLVEFADGRAVEIPEDLVEVANE